MLFGIGDLLIALGHLSPEFFNVSPELLIFVLQCLTAGLVGLPMAIRRCSWLPGTACRCRTHPPYVKRLGQDLSSKIRYYHQQLAGVY